MRENAIISFLGVALGVWPGIALTNVIMHTCEPESGFYPGAPTIQSIVIACVVTYLFSELLQRLLRSLPDGRGVSNFRLARVSFTQPGSGRQGR